MPQSSTPVSSTRQLVRWWGCQLLTTVLLALAIATRYFEAADLDGSAAALLFRPVVLLAHFATLTTLRCSPRRWC